MKAFVALVLAIFLLLCSVSATFSAAIIEPSKLALEKRHYVGGWGMPYGGYMGNYYGMGGMMPYGGGYYGGGSPYYGNYWGK